MTSSRFVNPLVPEAHYSERPDKQFSQQIKPLKVKLLIFHFCPPGTNGLIPLFRVFFLIPTHGSIWMERILIKSQINRPVTKARNAWATRIISLVARERPKIARIANSDSIYSDTGTVSHPLPPLEFLFIFLWNLLIPKFNKDIEIFAR